MQNKNKYIKDTLLVKIISGEASVEDKSIFEEWLKADSSNVEIYNEFKSTWNVADKATLNQVKENNWQQIKNKIDNSYNVPDYITIGKPQTREIRIGWSEIKKIAAILVVIIAIGFIYLNLSKNQNKTIISSSKESIKKGNILPDGSETCLNTGSKIEYSKNFNNNTRELKLYGSAYFKVTPNINKPFIINCANAIIKVVGTCFNVKTDSIKNEIIISVISGTVEISCSAKSAEKILVTKGEEGRVNIKTNELINSKITDNNFLSWKTGILTFEDTPLKDALSTIGKFYKKNIIIKNDSLNHYRLTSSYDNQQLDQVLSEIQLLTKIKYKIVNGIIYIE